MAFRQGELMNRQWCGVVGAKNREFDALGIAGSVVTFDGV